MRWWGDPEVEAALLEADLGEKRMVMRIVSCGSRPFAYVQDYDVQCWPQPQFRDLPAGTRAIDTFIGEPDMIGHGHGAAFLRLRAEQLKAAGAPVVAVDPSVDNLRACCAYARAGFRRIGPVETADGPILLMLHD
jgi:aminoglycoside 6'-N-acetyltransferase